jgi:hypothetical protein
MCLPPLYRYIDEAVLINPLYYISSIALTKLGSRKSKVLPSS